MTKKKVAISLDERLLDLIDRQRGNEKRSTYINNIIATHFKAVPEDQGGATFVTTLELRKTLKPLYDKVLVLDGLVADMEALREYVQQISK